MGKIDKKTLEQLNSAERELTLASTRVYDSARKVEPFRKSKFLNVLGKQILQMRVELAIFLGNHTLNVEEMEKTGYSFPSTKLLNIMQKDGELEK